MSDVVSRRRKAQKPPLHADARLIDWVARGAVSADIEGQRVPIDRGIPGELVAVEVDRRRKPWRGVVEAVVEPSPDRVAPPCPYYLAGCGGCQWQHLAYPAQVETKRILVDREMERAGVSCRAQGVHAMEEPWRYRHTAAIALGWEAGFRPRGRRGIVEIRDCPISHPLIGKLADELNELLRGGLLPHYHGKVWLDCTVVGTQRAPSVQVVIQGIEGLTLENHPELPDVAERLAAIPLVSSVAFRHRSGEPRALVGDLMSVIEVAGRPMYLPAGSFFQTNLAMVPRVLTRMEEVLADRKIRAAADVYGGVGTFGLPLASSVERMSIVELDPLAVEAAERTACEWGITNVEFTSALAERALPGIQGLDLAIVDPPRSGLGPVVTAALAGNRVPLVLYLSCSPRSLADDLAALTQAGYRVDSLEIFDFYPQTYHVESLAVLSL